jgi:hypothetical protein
MMATWAETHPNEGTLAAAKAAAAVLRTVDSAVTIEIEERNYGEAYAVWLKLSDARHGNVAVLEVPRLEPTITVEEAQALVAQLRQELQTRNTSTRRLLAAERECNRS